MIIWITGISASGKTTLAEYLLKKINKKFNFLHIDGDKFRDLFDNDLKYTKKDRDQNAKRLCSFVKYLSNQKINLLISANLTSAKYRYWCKRNLKKLLFIHLETRQDNLYLRDKKGIYQPKGKKPLNIVGYDINFFVPKKTIDIVIDNNSTKKSLYKNINEKLKSKKIF